MSGEISRDEVAHVASLARLRLDDNELDTFTEQLCVVLETAANLNSLDLSDVPPMAQPYPLTNVMRPDVLVPSSIATKSWPRHLTSKIADFAFLHP